MLSALLLLATGAYAGVLQYVPGQQYRYSYAVDVANSGSLSEMSSSALSLDAQFVMECWKKPTWFILRVESVQPSTNNNNGTIDQDAVEVFQAELTRQWVHFEMTEESEIFNVAFHRKEPEWARNLKRGMLSMLQLRLKNSQSIIDGNEYIVDEVDASGRVQVAYSIEDQGDQLVVRKKRNSQQSNFQQSYGYMSLVGEATYAVDKKTMTIMSAQVEDTNTLTVDSQHSIITKARADLKFIDVSSPFMPTELDMNEYQHTTTLELNPDARFDLTTDSEIQMDAEDSVQDVDEKLQEIRALFEQLAKDRTKNSDVFVDIINKLTMTRGLIKQVGEQLLQDPTIKYVVVDALIATASDEAFWYVSKTTEQDSQLVVQVMTNLGYVAGSYKMFDFVWPYAERGTHHAILAMGSMIYHSDMHRRARKALWMLEDKLVKATVEEDVILLLHALGNAGQKSSVDKILPFVDSESMEVQFAAIYALRRLGVDMPDEVVQKLQSVILDESKHQLLQEVALEVLVPAVEQQGGEQMLELLKSGQVASFFPFPGRGKGNKTVVPIYDKADEAMVVGNEQFGAKVGYRLTAYNPLSTDKDRTILNAQTYARVFAFGKKLDAFDGFVRYQGLFKQPEAFMYFAVGGSIWSECLDLVGTACSRRNQKQKPSAGRDGASCYERKKELFDFNAVLFRIGVKIPLVIGLFIDVHQRFGAYVHLDVGGKGCFNPMSATAALQPKIGMDIIAGASIDVFLAKAGVDIRAKVMYTALPSTLTVDASSLPVSICSNVHMHQELVAARFEAYAKLRDRVIRCGKKQWPCGLTWGHEISWSKEWDGFKRARWDRDLVKRCLNLALKFPGRPGRASISSKEVEVVAEDEIDIPKFVLQN